MFNPFGCHERSWGPWALGGLRAPFPPLHHTRLFTSRVRLRSSVCSAGRPWVLLHTAVGCCAKPSCGRLADHPPSPKPDFPREVDWPRLPARSRLEKVEKWTTRVSQQATHRGKRACPPCLVEGRALDDPLGRGVGWGSWRQRADTTYGYWSELEQEEGTVPKVRGGNRKCQMRGA